MNSVALFKTVARTRNKRVLTTVLSDLGLSLQDMLFALSVDPFDTLGETAVLCETQNGERFYLAGDQVEPSDPTVPVLRRADFLALREILA